MQSEEQQTQPQLILPDESAKMLTDILDRRLEADRDLRYRYLADWQRNHMYWDGQQDVYWDADHGRWRTVSEGIEDYSEYLEDSQQEEGGAINFYRARGESIIAAMTTDIPKTVFFPDNAESPEDVQTSKVYTKAAELLQVQNKSEEQDIEISTAMWLFGKAYGYTYGEINDQFGEDRVVTEEEVPETYSAMRCETCGYEKEDDSSPETAVTMEEDDCPTCGGLEPFRQVEQERTVTREAFKDVPATRQVVRICNPVECNVAPWAKNLARSPYIVLSERMDVSQARAMWPKYAKKITETDDIEGMTEFESGYLMPDGVVDTPRGTALIRHVWLRPWTFDPVGESGDDEYAPETLEEGNEDPEGSARDLLQRFPEGVYCLYCGNELVFARPENPDKHWDETINPLEPRGLPTSLGEQFIKIQNMLSENIGLMRDSIKYSVPITFAESGVLDLDKFREAEVRPGDYFNVTQLGEKPVANSFYSERAGQTPRDTKGFIEYLDQSGQTVVADHPSIHGGQGAGSKTFGEYRMAQHQAMQRIRIPWRAVGIFKSDIYGKAVSQYLDYLVQNNVEKNFVKREDGEFINVWINAVAATGKVGRVHPESSEAFPLNNAQKRDTLLEMANIPAFEGILLDPTNAQTIERLMGVSELRIPGSADRDWQMREIKLLIETPAPVSPDGQEGIDPATGMPASSLPPDQTDDHELHAQVIEDWCKSEKGWDVKFNNPQGWANVQAHWLEHTQYIAQQQMAEQPVEEESSQPPAQ